MSKEKVRGHVGLAMAVVGIVVCAVAFIPALSGTPLNELLNSMNGFWAAVGIGAILAGAMNMPAR